MRWQGVKFSQVVIGSQSYGWVPELCVPSYALFQARLAVKIAIRRPAAKLAATT